MGINDVGQSGVSPMPEAFPLAGIAMIRWLYVERPAFAGVVLARDVTASLSWESACMAIKKASELAGKSDGWTRFVDIPMGPYRKKDVDERYGTWDDFSSDLAGLLGAGYRVGVSYNAGNTSFIASVTCRADGDPNAGCTFTAFGGDWVTALQVAMFKHYVIASGVWSTVAALPAGGDAIG